MFRSASVFSLITIGMALAVALIGLALLPEGDRFAVHWDLQGNPNRFETRTGVAVSFLLLPVIMAVMHGVFWGVSKMEREREKLEQLGTVYAAIWGLTQATCLVIAVFVIDTIVAGHLRIDGLERILRIIVVLSALPLIVVGNILGKRRGGRHLPINLPRPLRSEESQGRFLRTTGRTLVGIGLVTFAAAFWSPLGALGVMTALCLLLPFGLLAYGRRLWIAEGCPD